MVLQNPPHNTLQHPTTPNTLTTDPFPFNVTFPLTHTSLKQNPPDSQQKRETIFWFPLNFKRRERDNFSISKSYRNQSFISARFFL